MVYLGAVLKRSEIMRRRGVGNWVNMLTNRSKKIAVMGEAVVYNRNHLFGLGSDTETDTDNWLNL